jgi:hypothetical protein
MSLPIQETKQPVDAVYRAERNSADPFWRPTSWALYNESIDPHAPDTYGTQL